jgi:hypothetical protein
MGHRVEKSNPELRFRTWKNIQQGNDELTLLSRVLPKKLTGSLPVKSPAYYGIQMFITRARHLPLS